MAASHKGSARRRSVGDGRPNNAQRDLRDEGRGNSNSTDEPQAFDFDDPVTGDVARATPNPDGSWVLSLWKLTEPSWFFELAEAVGLRDAYALKEDPRKYLAPYIKRNVAPREPEPLPTADDRRAWRRMLTDNPQALAYLLHERGLTREIIVRAGIGFTGRAFTIPILDVETRELVNLRHRWWPNPAPSGAKYTGLAGRTLENGGVTVYPGLPDGSLILCAGEFDALVLWRRGLPGITVTSGAGTRWRDEWAHLVKRRRVAVIYDADPREEQQAISRAAELTRCGADAWPVRLSRAGMSNGADITDWFQTRRRSAADLIALINRERGISRRRKAA